MFDILQYQMFSSNLGTWGGERGGYTDTQKRKGDLNNDQVGRNVSYPCMLIRQVKV